ncbi:MAG: DUF4349 domain-containing protein [Clostridiales bacterium]|nr:DUF4349 domain-containing protein [Clostridiales bacterium]
MKDEQRTERIMDWLESRMDAEEATAFGAEMANDPELAADCAVLSELTSRLRDLDAGFEPSADFHQNLMARLSLDNEQTERKLVNMVTDESKESMTAKVDETKENKENLTQTSSVWDVDDVEAEAGASIPPMATASAQEAAADTTATTAEAAVAADTTAAEAAEAAEAAAAAAVAAAVDTVAAAEAAGATVAVAAVATAEAPSAKAPAPLSAKAKNGSIAAALRSILSAFRRRPVIPVAAVCCVVVIGLVIGLGGRGGSYERNYMSGGGGSTGSSAMEPPASIAPSSPMAGGGPMYNEAVNYDMGLAVDKVQTEMQNQATWSSEYSTTGSYGEARVEEAEAEVAAADVAGNTSATNADGGGAPAQSSLAPSEQKIIRTGNIRMEVDHYGEAATSIKSMVDSLGGYITSENSYVIDYPDGRERRYGSISIKVPFNRYDQLFQQTQTLGKVMESSVWADDVTAQYVDLQARIAVFETKYQRLLALLQQSGELETILKIENELASTNADLESLKGSLRYLLSRTDYSTLDVNLMEKPIETIEIRATGFAAFWARLSEAFVTGVNRVIRNIGNFIIWLARNIIGLAIFALILWLAWFLWRRRRRGRRNSEED